MVLNEFYLFEQLNGLASPACVLLFRLMSAICRLNK